jgi:uncharacterized protein (DUF885 family)
MRKLFVLLAVILAAGCVVQQPANNSNSTNTTSGSGDAQFKTLHDKYVVDFLKRFPVVNTYLGGAGLDPLLKEVDGTLRDYSASAISAEDQWLTDMKKQFEAVDPNTLSRTRKIDRDVAIAQINFLLHQHGVRRYQERSVDSYTDEPFRGIDWQLQGMTTIDEKGGKYGTADEWNLVIKRLQAIPNYLKTAQGQLDAGVKSGNMADWRMLKHNGIESAEADAKYFAETLPKLASDRVSGDQRDDILNRLNQASKGAADAYTGFRDYVATTFFDGPNIKQQFGGDRYAMGEEEYNWALENNLRLDKTAAQLYDESWPVVQDTQRQMVQLAREIGKNRNMNLPQDDGDAVRAVIAEMSKDYPKTDAELVSWYKDAAFRLVDYARKTGLFDVPADYKLDVTETPPPLRASIDGAAYYPAPPFKNSGVGRFYVTTSGNNDQAELKKNNRASIADLSAHEGFPGHDWDYRVMAQYRDQINGVRWLTPGAVEDSSSMWEDSLASEGWALYSEALMAEPQPGFPNGFYTPEERFYQLQGQLYRDLRVRIDTGLHTGRLSYGDAVDLFSQIVDFEPGKCSDAAATANDSKRASCTGAEKAIFRYSKWPTQAITYRLGKAQILDLRKQAQEIAGNNFSLKAFHILFMKQGTIPPGYFKDELLTQVRNAGKM